MSQVSRRAKNDKTTHVIILPHLNILTVDTVDTVDNSGSIKIEYPYCDDKTKL